MSKEDLIRSVYLYTAFATSIVFAIFGILAGRMMSKLRSASTHDSLTGLCNRRFLLGQIPGLLANRERRSEPLCVLMLDLDHFKRVNDDHGHAVGDQTLVAVARSLEHDIRLGDLLARYGGEEFVVVCPNADERAGLQVAERMRRAVSSLGPRQLGFDGLQTVSIGLAVTRDKADDAPTLLKRADEALYEAKQTGRNRVCVFESE
jgi:diguanylate cyclase (GGDEF)-like protein